ncbi:MAG TPA: energy transducer TonB [Polyangia bacterium]|nr:energy transducer TonB [Polyangia bacterium]
MTRDLRLPICAVLSIAGHIVFAKGLSHLPAHQNPTVRRRVSIRVIAPPPPEEPPPEPVRAPEPPPKVPHERPRARVAPIATDAPPPKIVPPPDQPPAPAGDATPVFGISMESTSQAGSGPAMPVGRTPRPAPAARADAEPIRGGVIPVPAYQVTKMPVPAARCQGQGKYTPEAIQAAIEGTVVLDLLIDERGRVRDVQVVSGLGYGLTEAAIAAIKQCPFSPPEKDGTPVAFRLRGFKYRFVLPDQGE